MNVEEREMAVARQLLRLISSCTRDGGSQGSVHVSVAFLRVDVVLCVVQGSTLTRDALSSTPAAHRHQ